MYDYSDSTWDSSVFAVYAYCGTGSYSSFFGETKLPSPVKAVTSTSGSYKKIGISMNSGVNPAITRPSASGASQIIAWKPVFAYKVMAYDYGNEDATGSDGYPVVLSNPKMGYYVRNILGTDGSDTGGSRIYYSDTDDALNELAGVPVFNMDSVYDKWIESISQSDKDLYTENIRLWSFTLTINSPSNASKSLPPFSVYVVDMEGTEINVFDSSTSSSTFDSTGKFEKVFTFPNNGTAASKNAPIGILTPSQLHNLAYTGNVDGNAGGTYEGSDAVGLISDDAYGLHKESIRHATPDFEQGYIPGFDYHNKDGYFDKNININSSNTQAVYYGGPVQTISGDVLREGAFPYFDTIVSPATNGGERCGVIYIQFDYLEHDVSTIKDNGTTYSISNIQLIYNRCELMKTTMGTLSDTYVEKCPEYYSPFMSIHSDPSTGETYTEDYIEINSQLNCYPSSSPVSAYELYSNEQTEGWSKIYPNTSYQKDEPYGDINYAHHMTYSSLYYTTGSTTSDYRAPGKFSGNDTYYGINSYRFRAGAHSQTSTGEPLITCSICGPTTVTLSPNSAETPRLSCGNIRIDGTSITNRIMDQSSHVILFDIKNTGVDKLNILGTMAISASIPKDEYEELIGNCDDITWGGVDGESTSLTQHEHMHPIMANTSYRFPVFTAGSRYKIYVNLSNCIKQLCSNALDPSSEESQYSISGVTQDEGYRSDISIDPEEIKTFIINLPANTDNKARYFDVAIMYKAYNEGTTTFTKDLCAEESLGTVDESDRVGFIQKGTSSTSMAFSFNDNDRYGLSGTPAETYKKFITPNGTIFNYGQEIFNYEDKSIPMAYEGVSDSSMIRLNKKLMAINLADAEIKMIPLKVSRYIDSSINASTEDEIIPDASAGECLPTKYGIISIDSIANTETIDMSVDPNVIYPIGRHNDLYDFYNESLADYTYLLSVVDDCSLLTHMKVIDATDGTIYSFERDECKDI